MISSRFSFFLIARIEPDQIAAGTRNAYISFLHWAPESYDHDLNVQLSAICDHGLERSPRHDRFITPATEASHPLSGPVEAVAERRRAIGTAGVTGIAALRGPDRPFCVGDELDQLADLIERVG